ncbi:MAG: hypothetical protein Homavirus23_4 [Homavirus sp.]|uniref:Uncharacterized protein n=1 Tax=Homavirus sp. TaxID=2487769 RepID=A0A3G5A8X0_9VIRU|nr:MAG: hypothetical protein Homavirus23_4 [Homavirus sp.]
MIKIILLLVVICLLYFIYTKYLQIEKYTTDNITNIENTESPINMDTQPILTYYKSGGIQGYTFRLEFFNDKTYKLFEFGDELVKKGVVDDNKFKTVLYLIDKMPSIKYTENKVDGFDLMYESLESRTTSISLTNGVYIYPTIPDEFIRNVNIIDKIIFEK